VLFLCTIDPGIAQDSPFDNQQLWEARDLFDSDDIDEAKGKYELLVDKHCTGDGNSDVCIEAKLGLINIARRNGNNEIAETLANESSEYVSQYMDNESLYRVKIEKIRLLHSIDLNRMDKADEWASRLQRIISADSSDSFVLAYAHQAIGYYEDMLGNYEDAIYHYSEALEFAERVEPSGEVDRLLLQTHNNLGVSYRNMEELDEAMNQYELSLDIIHRLFGKDNPNEAGTFINLGTIYYSKGDIGLAAEYFRRSVEIFRSLTGDFGSSVGASLNNLAATQYMLGNYDKSADYFEEAQRIKEESLGYDHPETAIGYSNLASIHILNQNFQAARENIERSITVRENIYGTDHPNLIDPIYRLGDLNNQQLREYDEARQQYQLALSIATERLGETHPDVTDIYIKIGTTYLEEEIYSDAEQYFDRAIRNLYGSYDFDNPIDLNTAISNPVTLVIALSYKARLLKEKSGEVHISNYQDALMALDWTFDLIDVVQKSFKNEASKLRLIENNYSIYTDAIEILAALYKETDHDKYKHRMFEIIEKSRSRVALELIQDVNAQNFSGVPADILEEETSLSGHLTQLQQELYLEESSGFDKDTERIIELSDSIFQYKRELEDFTTKLEEEFPSYYTLKYDQSVIDMRDAQSLLQSDEVVLSYVLGNNLAYVLVMSKNGFDLVELGETSAIEDQTIDLKEHVLANEMDAYKQKAHNLYELLMQPLEEYISGKQLLIMADQALHYLPFEMLLKEVPDHDQFHNYPYLIREHTISYIPSLTLLREMNIRVADNPRNMLAVAPFSSEIEEEDRALMDHRYTTSATPLYLTQYETTTISSHFKGRKTLGEYFRPQKTELLLGDDATFSRFSSAGLSDYDYIHFATHAFINEENPEYSGILLYPEAENPGVAYVGDIYNLELDANLVVLGACQTGLGSIYKGEGLIGFTRAFIYAGASNLAVSMWRVSDQPTAYLMIDFYDLIRQGYDYNEALQQAKLNLIAQPQFANPVHWAAFTLTGR
jgi:CHAT domain-containing protein/Tfp pilus assembly protein PilF